jgi:hypothetical protein
MRDDHGHPQGQGIPTQLPTTALAASLGDERDHSRRPYRLWYPACIFTYRNKMPVRRRRIDVVLTALLYALLASSGFFVGVLVWLITEPPRRLVAAIVAFGGGVLVSALTFDLMEEAKGSTAYVIMGFLAGALIYVLADLALERMAGEGIAQARGSGSRERISERRAHPRNHGAGGDRGHSAAGRGSVGWDPGERGDWDRVGQRGDWPRSGAAVGGLSRQCTGEHQQRGPDAAGRSLARVHCRGLGGGDGGLRAG